MKLFPPGLLLSLSILVSLVLSSGCIGQSSQSTPLEEKTQSESKQDISLSVQEEPGVVSKPVEAPIQPMTYWAIPFLSTREALQLYDLLDEDTKVRAKELISIYGVQVVNQTLTSQECKDYFGEDGLFGQAKKISFQRSFIDFRCFEKLPRTLTDLTFYKSQLIHQEMIFSEKIWVKVLESIAEASPHLQSLSIDLISKTDEMLCFRQKATAVIAKKMISLKYLTIEAFMREKATREIAQGNLTQLTHLGLSGNLIGDEGVKVITSGNLSHLTHLDLSLNAIGPKGAESLVHGNLKTLTHLDLAWNRIGALGAEFIFQGNLPSLIYLDIGFNKIGSAGALAATHTSLKNLTHLNLCYNQIGEKKAQTLVEELPYLTHLDLSFNDLGENSYATQECLDKANKYAEKISGKKLNFNLKASLLDRN